MFNHKKLAKKQKQFLSITGVAPQQFDSLSKEIQKQYKITKQNDYPKKKEKETSVQDTSLIILSKIES